MSLGLFFIARQRLRVWNKLGLKGKGNSSKDKDVSQLLEEEYRFNSLAIKSEKTCRRPPNSFVFE